jgi:hypothetical protein
MPPFVVIYQRLISGYEDAPESKYWSWWPTPFATEEEAERFASELERMRVSYGEEGREYPDGMLVEDVTDRTVTYTRVVDAEQLPPEHPMRGPQT